MAKAIETLVAFHPSRPLDYVAFERRATDLGLDAPLRHAAAVDAATTSELERGARSTLHSLEANFDLSAHDILDIIHTRMRLEVAVKGGVAEHHLERRLAKDASVSSARSLAGLSKIMSTRGAESVL